MSYLLSDFGQSNFTPASDFPSAKWVMPSCDVARVTSCGTRRISSPSTFACYGLLVATAQEGGNSAPSFQAGGGEWLFPLWPSWKARSVVPFLLSST